MTTTIGALTEEFATQVSQSSAYRDEDPMQVAGGWILSGLDIQHMNDTVTAEHMAMTVSDEQAEQIRTEWAEEWASQLQIDEAARLERETDDGGRSLADLAGEWFDEHQVAAAVAAESAE